MGPEFTQFLRYYVKQRPYLERGLRWLMSVSALTLHPQWVRWLPEWWLMRRVRSNLLENGVPWLPLKACHWLDSVLDETSRVFEYGSGGSTIFLARRVGELVSVEHDQVWYERVSRVLGGIKRAKCDYVFIKPFTASSDGSLDPSDPVSYTSALEPDVSFEEYVRYIDRFPDNFFDVVLIDGRARPSCVWHAIPKVKPGGYIMLDDAGRPRYRKAVKLLRGWKRIDLSGIRLTSLAFHRTLAWRKP